jgi:phosphoserine phosphatase
MQSDSASNILACDLDGTLIDVNSFPRFVRFAEMQLRRQRRWVPWLKIIWAAANRLILRGEHSRFKAAVCSVGDQLDDGAIEAWVVSLLDEHLNHQVCQLVQTWNGVAVLTTAAPEVYASKIADKIGFDCTHASRIVAGVLDNNESHRKCERIAELSGVVELAVTDDPETDGPLLALASKGCIVVNGELMPFDLTGENAAHTTT